MNPAACARARSRVPHQGFDYPSPAWSQSVISWSAPLFVWASICLSFSSSRSCASARSAFSSRGLMLARWLFKKPNMKNHRSSLLVANRTRAPPPLPRPGTPTRFFWTPPPRSTTHQAVLDLTDGSEQGRIGQANIKRPAPEEPCLKDSSPSHTISLRVLVREPPNRETNVALPGRRVRVAFVGTSATNGVGPG